MAARVMPREFSDEIFPAEAGYFGERTRKEFQGGEDDCTFFGGTSAIESYVHAWEEQQGIPLEDSLQLSPAFPWRLLKASGGVISVESMIATLNKFGTCLERLYPYVVEPTWPYHVTTLDNPPSAAAWLDAQSRKIDVRIERISGKFAIARAFATGSRLITTRVGGNMEHSEAGVYFHQDKGVFIHGSGNSFDWEPWESFEAGGRYTQVYAITHCNLAPMIAHPDYRPPTPAHFADGVLTIPYLTILPPPGLERWQEPWQHYRNVKVHFGSDIGPENVQWNDPEVTHMDVRWKPASEAYGTPHTLSLFAVEVGGTVYRKVTVKGVVPTIVSFEPATA